MVAIVVFGVQFEGLELLLQRIDDSAQIGAGESDGQLNGHSAFEGEKRCLRASGFTEFRVSGLGLWAWNSRFPSPDWSFSTFWG